MLRVLVCGGRDYRDLEKVREVLDGIHAERGIALIIEGGQRTYERARDHDSLVGGADGLAWRWAKCRGVPCVTEAANWRRRDGSIDYGAGPARNTLMLERHRPDVGVVFPGGRGTADMRGKLAAAKVEIIDVAPRAMTASAVRRMQRQYGKARARGEA